MKRKRWSITLAVALLALSVPASAGVLQSDTNSIPAFTGITNMSINFYGITCDADVEFAVYAPNAGASNFDATFGLGADPTGGLEFVYAYQVFNLTAPLATPVTSLTVGLDGDEYNVFSPPVNVGFVAGTGTIAPSASSFVTPGLPTAPTSVRWDFLSPTIPLSTTSDVLFFTSSDGPEWDFGTIGASWSGTSDVPSPMPTTEVPEPATLSLLALGGIACLRRRRRV